jgi:hypothetical protein
MRAGGAYADGVAVGYRFGSHISADGSACAASVVNNDLLAQALGKLLRHNTANNVS